MIDVAGTCGFVGNAPLADSRTIHQQLSRIVFAPLEGWVLPSHDHLDFKTVIKNNKTISGILFLLVAALVGFLLVYLPPQIIAQYETAQRAGRFWGILYLVTVIAGSSILLAVFGWILWKLLRGSLLKRKQREERNKNPSELSRQQKEKEFRENLESIEKLKSEPFIAGELRQQIDPLVRQVAEKRELEKLEIVAFGSISSGKSSILNLLAGRNVFTTDARGGTTVSRNEVTWPNMDKVTLVDTPGLGEIDGAEHVNISAKSAKDADLVLVVVDGPIRDYEFRLLEKLGDMEKRTLICVNKSDWFEQKDLKKLMDQIAAQTRSFVNREDIVAVRAEPSKRLRKRVLANGQEIEEMAPVEPDIGSLAERMMKVLQKEGTDLLLANLLLQSRGLVEQARQRVKESLDKRARQIVDKYMWGSAGIAAVSPFPLVDLAAGCAISSKMVLDLAKVYQQKMDLETALQLLSQLGKHFIGFLGSTLAAPAVAAIAGSLLKTVPGIGTIVGGMLQGIGQALITRWIGAVFIEYFRNEMSQPEGGLAGLARRQWERLTTVDELRKLVKDARQHLGDSD